MLDSILKKFQNKSKTVVKNMQNIQIPSLVFLVESRMDEMWHTYVVELQLLLVATGGNSMIYSWPYVAHSVAKWPAIIETAENS